MKKQEKMDPAQRDAYQTLLNELENMGEEATPTRQILQLALQLDEKGEFYKFIAEHNMPETEKYFYRLTKSNN